MQLKTYQRIGAEGTPENYYRAWTVEDFEQLLFLWFAAASSAQMAQALGRTLEGILTQLVTLRRFQNAEDELWDEHDCQTEGCREAWAQIQKEALV